MVPSKKLPRTLALGVFLSKLFLLTPHDVIVPSKPTEKKQSEASQGTFSDLLPDSLPEDADSLVAEQLLRLLGLPREEAGEIARRPLPRSCEQLLLAAERHAG